MFIQKLRTRASRGFTLVELLVVIAIIGILATMLLLQLGVGRQKARDARRIVDINQLRTAVELYFDDNGGEYPQAITINELGPYITIIPNDPLTGSPYGYGYQAANPLKYQIWAELEGSSPALNSDADIAGTGAGWTGGAANSEACTSAANDCIYDQGQD